MSWNPFAAKPRTAVLPDGVRLFAIGDVHGRADLLRTLLNAIIEAGDGAERLILVGLGDYIDRGPESREVIDLLLGLDDVAGLETHFLLGNHERTLIDFLADAKAGPAWSQFGGRETLASYGVAAPRLSDDAEGWQAARQGLKRTLPARHQAFFKRLQVKFELGDYFFAHAGARPGKTLDEQEAHDLYWIREPFLKHRKAFEKVIVHGHSPDVAVHADHRRIGIDTGAYATGVLTALRLENGSRSLLQTSGGGTRTAPLD